VATMKRAEAHVAAVEKYPELQGMTQVEALAIGQQLDQLPANEREQRRAALRHEASRAQEKPPQQAVSGTSSRPQRRQLRDPDRPWLKAMYSLWVFRENTRDRESVLAMARRWSRETVQRYLQEIRQVKDHLIVWERSLEALLSPEDAYHLADGQTSPRCADRRGPSEETPPGLQGVPEASAQTMGETRHKGAEGSTTAPHTQTLPVEAVKRAGIMSSGVARDHTAPMAETADITAPSRETPEAARAVKRLVQPPVHSLKRNGIAAEPETEGPWKSPSLGEDAHVTGADNAATQSGGSPREEVSDTDGSPARRGMAAARVKTLQAYGLSLRAIAVRLNAEDVATVNGQGQWDHRKIARLLQADGARGRNTPMKRAQNTLSGYQG
jgi:hypothetical protein